MGFRLFTKGNYLISAAMLLAMTAPAQVITPEANNFVMNSFALCPFNRTWDGQWLGTTVASDGRCYFGSSAHDSKHGAGFFRYDPSTGVFTLLAEDLTAICGENVRFTPPQGKLHSDIVEFNGWLYFSTHLGNYWIEAENAFTGGHVIGYELATGHFRDFGVVRSNYTCYSAVGVDKVRGKLLSFVTRYWGPTQNSYIYLIDIATGAKEAFWPVPGFNTFFFFVDTRGDCWISCERDNGSLRVVRSATRTMEVFPGMLPEAQLGANRWWDWAKPLPDGNTCVFKMFNGNYLYSFNANIFQTNHVAAFAQIRNIGPAPSGVALGSNRVYYVQRANRQPGNQEYTDFHLMSVPIFTNTPIIDHGLIMDQSGRLVWRLPGMAADAMGRLYAVGDWWLLPGEQGTIAGTLRHEDLNNSSNYFAFPRGEFFAAIDLSQSASLMAQRALSLTTSGGGTISADPPGDHFIGNATVNLTAAPNSGWTFMGWSGDAGGTTPATTIVMTRDKAVQAVFGTSLITSALGQGSILRNPAQALYPFNATVRLAALPQAGSFFSTWGSGASGDITPIDYAVTNPNQLVTASFNGLNSGRVALSLIVNGKGRILSNPRVNSSPAGQVVSLDAVPDPGQSFLGWTGGFSGTNSPISVILNQTMTITAAFTSRPSLSLLRFQSGGQGPEISFSGDIGASYNLLATTDFVDWITLTRFTNSFGTFQFTDPATDDLNYRFYRALLVP